MLTLAPFIYWGFFWLFLLIQKKLEKSLLVESCHLHAYTVNPTGLEKKEYGVLVHRHL